MDRHSVESSNIAAVGYDSKEARLEVEFISGVVYEYYDVEQTMYDDWMQSGSIGSFFHHNIKNRYHYKKLS